MHDRRQGRGRPLRRAAVVVATVALTATLSGCSTAVVGAGRPAAVVVTAGEQRPATVLAASQEALSNVQGYAVHGTLEYAGAEVTVDLAMGYTSGHGTLTRGDVTATLDYVSFPTPPGGSGLYVTASAAYWQQAGVGADLAASYDGREVSIPTSSPLAAGYRLLDRTSFAGALFSGLDDTGAHVLASPDVDAQPAWVVTSADRSASITVQINGQQFPLRVHTPLGDLRLDHFGEEPKVTTPPTGQPLLSLPG